MPLASTIDRVGLRPLIERFRERPVERIFAASLAILLEGLLLLALIALGEQQLEAPSKPAVTTVTFDVKQPAKPTQQQKTTPKDDTAALVPRIAQAQSQPSSQVAVLTPPLPPAAIIPLAPSPSQSFDLRNVPNHRNAPAAPTYGPVAAPAFGDSQRVGTAPNGDAMYAARWYPHEPTDEQMAGYLSTADPGWALITCKTVQDYRVEDCVGLDEYPEGAHLIRAAIAASWQYRVRAPQVGGVTQVGDWVRIRIEYEVRSGNPYADRGSR